MLLKHTSNLPDDSSPDAHAILPTSPGPKKSSSQTCHICLKKLSILTRQRHHCRLCGNSVCSKDSDKRSVNERVIRTCVRCVETTLGKAIQQQLVAKVKDVKDKCEEYKHLICKDMEIASETTTWVKSLECRIEEANSASLHSISESSIKLEEEEQRGKKLRETVESLQALIEEANQREQGFYNRIIQVDALIAKRKQDIYEAQREAKEITQHIEVVKPKLAAGIGIAEASKIICKACQRSMGFNAFTPAMESVLEDSSFDSSQSSVIV